MTTRAALHATEHGAAFINADTPPRIKLNEPCSSTIRSMTLSGLCNNERRGDVLDEEICRDRRALPVFNADSGTSPRPPIISAITLRRGGRTAGRTRVLRSRSDAECYDGIIGVAVNGFYQPAVVKAKRHGVVLYDFRSLTDAEIASWGGLASVETTFIQFEPLLITAAIESAHRQMVGLAPVFQCNGKDGYTSVMQLVRDNAAANPGSHRVELLNPTGFEVDGASL